MQVEKVHPNFAAQKWHLAEPHFQRVTPHVGGDWTDDQFKADVLTGRIGMLLAMDGGQCVGAAAYNMQNRRNSRTAFILSVAGEGLVGNADAWSQLVAIFKSDGATAIEAAMRPSMVRLSSSLGFKSKYAVVGMPI